MHPSFPPAPPQGDLDAHEVSLRKDLTVTARLADSACNLLPAFMPQSAIERMGLEAVAELVFDFREALSNWFCEPILDALEKLARYRSAAPYKFPKPTIEDLAKASLAVQRLEESLGAMEEMSTSDKYGLSAATNLMRPLIEQQLDQARDYLTRIQFLMEAPDEPEQSPMSKVVSPAKPLRPNEADL